MSAVLIVPRSPHPIDRTEQWTDYEKHDVPLIRAAHPELKDHTDAEIACLWTWYSVEWMCAGWMTASAERSRSFVAFLSWERTSAEWLEAWKYG